MRELTQVLRFSPRTTEDEMRIYRTKPIAWTDSSVALLNEYGATLCTPDREATPLDLPEAGIALLGLSAVDDDEE